MFTLPMHKTVTTIYFDLDNTLIDRNAAMEHCLRDFFEHYLPHVYFDNAQPEWEEHDDWGYADREDFVAWFIQYYQPAGWEEGSFWNYLQTHISQHVAPISSALRQQLTHWSQHYRLGILTNGSLVNQSRKIKQAGLDQLIAPEHIHISQQHQLAKPDLRLFERLLEQEALAPEQLLYVGDDPTNDILPAHQLGISTAWVSHHREWSHTLVAPDYIVEQVLNLPL